MQTRSPLPSDAAAHGASAPPAPPWWQRAVIYQVYPLSFQDSDGDGRGDLPGVLARLDHLSWLGVNALWLGPVFRSPMHDFGYDIADFTAVDPVFGGLDDLDRLIEALHARGLRLILDFVPNHTSDRHAWFAESRSSRDNPKRDWYVWADPAPGGGPPNGWLSRFGGSAWQWDAATGQYYYHAFLESQPDLNWRNPEVRAAMAEVLRFWLRRGVDGFRIDAAAVLAEDERLREDPPDPEADEHTPPPDRVKREYTDYRPEVLGWLAGLRRVVDEFPERVLLGEVDGAGERIAHFYGDARRPIMQLPLNYRLHEAEWHDAAALAAAIEDYLGVIAAVGGWPNWLLGGHDKPRIADVAGHERTRVALMLQLTLPGTPVVYQGDEIGQRGVHAAGAAPRDPFERRVPGYGLNRDPERAPMRWHGGRHGGFTEGTPWLPMGGGIEACNVEDQRADPRSQLALVRALIALRRERPELASSALCFTRRDGAVLCCLRGLAAQPLMVALNLGGAHEHAALPSPGPARVLLGTRLDRAGETVQGRVALRPYEGVIVAFA